MMTSLACDITALATATDWRCPPDSEATGWRIERTVVTESSFSVLRAAISMVGLVEHPVAQRLVAEEHVLDDVQVVAQREVLIDRRDAQRLGVPGPVEMDAAALPQDLATIRAPTARRRS